VPRNTSRRLETGASPWTLIQQPRMGRALMTSVRPSHLNVLRADEKLGRTRCPAQERWLASGRINIEGCLA
jgi:hypothetical protein